MRASERERGENTTVLSKRRKIKIRVYAGGGEIGRAVWKAAAVSSSKPRQRPCTQNNRFAGIAAELLRPLRNSLRESNPIRSLSCAPEGVSTGGVGHREKLVAAVRVKFIQFTIGLLGTRCYCRQTVGRNKSIT